MQNEIPITDHNQGKINTVSGIELDYLNLTPEMICLEDIARGLANTCRFGGQINEFYSVAQHSVLVSYLVPQHLALEALLHDAHESVCNDVVSPFKKLIGPIYKTITDSYDDCLRRRFKLIYSLGDPFIKLADVRALTAEAGFLRNGSQFEFMALMNNYNMVTNAYLVWPPKLAYLRFLSRFNEIQLNETT